MNGWLVALFEFYSIRAVIRAKGVKMRRLFTMAALMGCLTMGITQLAGGEVPRPDMFRENWATLNGAWQFEIDAKNDGEARSQNAVENRRHFPPPRVRVERRTVHRGRSGHLL
jgi:hypothetical protein